MKSTIAYTLQVDYLIRSKRLSKELCLSVGNLLYARFQFCNLEIKSKICNLIVEEAFCVFAYSFGTNKLGISSFF